MKTYVIINEFVFGIDEYHCVVIGVVDTLAKAALYISDRCNVAAHEVETLVRYQRKDKTISDYDELYIKEFDINKLPEDR